MEKDASQSQFVSDIGLKQSARTITSVRTGLLNVSLSLYTFTCTFSTMLITYKPNSLSSCNVHQNGMHNAYMVDGLDDGALNNSWISDLIFSPIPFFFACNVVMKQVAFSF